MEYLIVFVVALYVIGSIIEATEKIIVGLIITVCVICAVLFVVQLVTSDCECGIIPSFRNFGKVLFKNNGKLFAIDCLFTIISIMSTREVISIIKDDSGNENMRRAKYIAVVIGLMLTSLMFTYPVIKDLFDGYTPGRIATFFIITTSGVSGWYVWWLKTVPKYGDFFYILLMTLTIGFGWYARISGFTALNYTASTFIICSLFKIAKDSMDAKGKLEQIRSNE